MARTNQLSEWTAAKMAVMASGSWFAAMGLIRPPQCGHFRASIVHTLSSPTSSRAARTHDAADEKDDDTVER